MKIEVVKIADLKAPEKNIRAHGAKQLKELYRSYKMFGQFRPVVVDENNVILAGNGFVEALKTYGETEVKVLRYTNLTEDQKKKLMIADNRTYALGSDINDNIMALLSELSDFDVPGYDEDILKELLADQKDVDEAIYEYGKLSDEEIEEIRKTEERMRERVSGISHSETSVSHSETEEEEYDEYEDYEAYDGEDDEDEERYATPPEVYKSTRKTIICPHCGKEIILS